MIGSRVPQFDGSAIIGNSDILVMETDEYQNKFKYFKPKAILLNNIEYDHPDFFPSPDDYSRVFIEFIKKIPAKGFLVANYDDPIIKKTAAVNCLGKIISYAIESPADYNAYDIKTENNKTFFKVKLSEAENEDGFLGDFSISLIGKHNVYNALAVICASIELGVELRDIRGSLSEFAGTTRRMETMGAYKGVEIIDDYAHHPTEIRATLSALKEKYKDNEILVVFHPHTYSRTKALLNDFAESFSDADKIIVLDIYGSAREVHGGAHSRDLVEKIKKNNCGKEVVYIPNLLEAEKYLRQKLVRGQKLVLMGAGDVFRIGENLLKN
jgi:UDP-N-acetylmuramate--alanine ligase